MQISDLFHSYNRNMTLNETAESATLSRAENGSVGLRGPLNAGAIFEGVVTKQKNGNVVLTLGNGETINAKLGGNVNLSNGQSVFFEVEGYNESNQILIHTVTGENAGNPAIHQALTTAGLPNTSQNIQMVQTLMEHQLPIDRNSLQNMARTILNYPETSVDHLVLMNKLGIPVNQTNVALLENYQTDRSMILKEMGHMMDAIPELIAEGDLSSEHAMKLTANVFSVLADGMSQSAGSISDWVSMETFDYEEPAVQVMISSDGQEMASYSGTQVADLSGNESSMDAAEALYSDMGSGSVASLENASQPNAMQNPNAYVADFPEGNRKIPLSIQDFGRLSEDLAKLAESRPELKAFLNQDATIKPNVTAGELLQGLSQVMQTAKGSELEDLHAFFSSRGFGKILENVMEKQWLLQPEEVFSKDQIKELYERLDSQMAKLQEVFLKDGGESTKSLADNAQNVRDNISFLNEINHAYAYLQIPLKMSNENIHSDLYVYSNKKSMSDGDGKLSAYLSLDMKHLGKTDVYVEMTEGNRVTTNFYLEDEKSFDLIMSHIEELTKRITDRGYPCTATVENKAKPQDFVEDFLKQGENVGSVHRYSFDVKA